MRIGISVSGKNSVHLAEVLRRIGHDVTLVSVGYYEELTKIDDYKCVSISEVKEPFNTFIDTFGNISNVIRKQLGNKVVIFVDENITITLRENIIYSKDRRAFVWDGADEVWTWWSASVETLRILSKVKVVCLPFYWSPCYLIDLPTKNDSLAEPKFHIIGSNKSICSSVIQSMILCCDLDDKIIVHCDEKLVGNEYFINNIKPALSSNIVLSGEFNLTEALLERNCVISNLRFADCSAAAVRELLDFVWIGMPLIHNSEWLRDFGYGYESLYFENASQLEAAIQSVKSGWKCSRDEVRKALEAKVSSLEGWTALVPVYAKPMIIQFSDFWADFNPDYNFFTLLFTEALLAIGDKRKIVGVGEGFDGRADLVICGPYSEHWRSLDPTIPKICFTGELSEPVYGDGIFLNIGFFQNGYNFTNTRVNYCRFPLWAASINWFGADNGRLVNPTLIDIDECLAEHPGVTDRQKFCAFVVSNPTCQVRNEAFKTLHAYKHVDSAGALFNNMGNGLFAGLGGGGGERRKVEFFKDYKFALVYENSSCNGYTTEKLFHAKVAGCVPLYWGDPTAAQDFDPKGYVNLTNREGDLLDVVRVLEQNPEEMEAKAREPALSVGKLDKLRDVLGIIAKYTLDNVFPSEKELWQQLPRCLGARSTAEACRLAERRLACGAEVGPLVVKPEMTEEFGRKVKDMLFVTSASEEKAGDLYLWLSHMNSIALSTKAEFRLYWTGEHCSRRLKYIKESYDWIKIICVKELSLNEIAVRENRLICYMSVCTVIIGNPFYMCAVADQTGACMLKHRDQLVEDGSLAPMTDVVIIRGGCSTEQQRIFAENFVGFSSLEESRIAGKVFYNWSSGNFKYKPPFLTGISECSLINLKRRPDRLRRFAKDHNRWIVDRIKVVDAVDGRRLKLTPHIQRLFEGGSFGWKKGVIGCNLSHLSVWYSLAHSNQFIENMLVLEDDVRFVEGWESKLEEAMMVVPADFDVLYLGGILPPNKAMWSKVRVPVNQWWDRIGENTSFGQNEPTAYFHFCAYAYILSKRGAEKLLDGIKRDDGYKRVSDHQILNPVNNMNVYVMNPIIAGCYQEDDPIYLNTNFNATEKEHTYDSDLWTNSDCFTVEGVATVKLDVSKVITDLESCDEDKANTEIIPLSAVSPPIVFLSEDASKTYEKEWLSEIMNMSVDAWDHAIITDTEAAVELAVQTAKSHLLVIYRQVSEEENNMLVTILNMANNYKKRLIIIHLSDEYKQNDISFYENNSISLVIRNYVRSDIPSDIRKKVLTIPLGWYRRSKNPEGIHIENRQLLWSFHGTSWFNRKHMIDVLRPVEPHSLHVRDGWDKQMTSSELYLTDIERSIFVPCPEGNNAESFRIYEALEAGCMPILVDEGRGPLFYKWIQSALPSIIVARSWESALRVFDDWKADSTVLIERHKQLMEEWNRWKTHLQSIVKKFVFWA